MAELKRKQQELTTADLAGRSEEKRSTPENRMPDRTAEGHTSEGRLGEGSMKDERARPSLVKPETRQERIGQTRQERPGSAAAPVAGSSPLFSESDMNDLRGRWSNVQSNFVDEPRRAVEEADKLVAAVMQRLADGFSSERSNLEKQWDRGDNVSTEDLRVALQRYRNFFDRLLNA